LILLRTSGRPLVNQLLAGKPEGKRSLGRRRLRHKSNVEINYKETGSGTVDWIHLPQGRVQWWAVVKETINLRVPYKDGNFVTS